MFARMYARRHSETFSTEHHQLCSRSSLVEVTLQPDGRILVVSPQKKKKIIPTVLNPTINSRDTFRFDSGLSQLSGYVRRGAT